LQQALETIRLPSTTPSIPITTSTIPHGQLSYEAHKQLKIALAEFETQKAEIIEILRRQNF
jgi:hypothetical protein